MSDDRYSTFIIITVLINIVTWYVVWIYFKHETTYAGDGKVAME